ncbi:hypothetical protein G6O69_18315 [Pseudenhygromyxa sp. WMMC2535]|uniref:hypothetical protein n=1 Tax=Pseudenhygromyxa sp. WMMC2535 TaxID=2712867 RepID=UPI001594F8E5|nr:hypothetical protein [Pseudenhygromyxa sp. WMMC2535]NVB39804.1 hypothetical protein [Pseudenhygromyxa sp. WMMC2535]
MSEPLAVGRDYSAVTTDLIHKLGPFIAAMTLPLLLTACPDVAAEDEGEEVDETADETTDETDTGSESTTGDETETGEEEPGESGDPINEGTEGQDEETTGGNEEIDPEAEALCTTACELFESCGQDNIDCFESCVEYFGGFSDDQECLDAGKALTECIGGLTCGEVEQMMLEEPQPYPCQAEQEAACEPEVCTVAAGVGEESQECELSIDCEGDPLYSVECDAEGCICFEDGAELTTCALQEEICGSSDADLIYTCCFG